MCYLDLGILVDAAAPLQHVPEKLIDFSDENMLQSIDFKCFPFDRMSPSDRTTLDIHKLEHRLRAKPLTFLRTML